MGFNFKEWANGYRKEKVSCDVHGCFEEGKYSITFQKRTRWLCEKHKLVGKQSETYKTMFRNVK